MNEIDDAYRRIQSSDAHSAKEWVRLVEPRLGNSLRSFARHVDVDAIVQEGLLIMWDLAGELTLEGENASLRYALRVVRNLAGHENRRINRLRELAQRWPDSIPLDPDGVDDRSEALPDPFLREAINDCISKLPEQQRKALNARLNSKGAIPDRALAKGLGMGLNAFHKNIGRSRENLALCLESRGIPVKELLGMTAQKTTEILIEAASAAFRELDAEGRVLASPAWWDLTPDGRESAFELQLASRRLERAVDPEGLSTTARAVLARRKKLDQME